MYVIILVAVLVFPTVYFLGVDPGTAKLFTCLGFFLSITSSTVLIFVPKMVKLFGTSPLSLMSQRVMSKSSNEGVRSCDAADCVRAFDKSLQGEEKSGELAAEAKSSHAAEAKSSHGDSISLFQHRNTEHMFNNGKDASSHSHRKHSFQFNI